MPVSKLTFLYCFLPVILIAYFLVPSRWRGAVLLAAGLVFCVWEGTASTGLFALAMAIFYLVGLAIGSRKTPRAKRAFLAISIIAGVGMLLGCKYAASPEPESGGVYVVRGSAVTLDYPLDKASVANAAEKFQSIYDSYLSGGTGKIVFSVVPDKGYYLAEAKGCPSMDYEALFDAFRGLTWAQHVDLTSTLDASCYYATDSHWRQECLLPVAARLARALDAEAEADYTITKLERPFRGVYDSQAALESDEIWLLENDVLRACRVCNPETGAESRIYDEAKLKSRNLYDVFLSGEAPVLTVENPAAGSGRELIVFRDSFASSLVPLLLSNYAKVTLVDIRYTPAEDLDRLVDFENQDVLFLYSTTVLNHSEVLL